MALMWSLSKVTDDKPGLNMTASSDFKEPDLEGFCCGVLEATGPTELGAGEFLFARMFFLFQLFFLTLMFSVDDFEELMLDWKRQCSMEFERLGFTSREA